MLRISTIERTDQVTLRLEGRVVGPWVAEVRRLSGSMISRHGSLTLDLGGVSFIDSDGLALFRELQQGQVIFLNCSTFIAEQLKGVDDHDQHRD